MHQASILSHNRPATRRLARAVPGAAALLTLCLGSGAVSADDAGLRDCVLAARARQALVQDNALAPLNLGVSVRAGVATVWGQVPSAGLGRRAEDKVRKVAGIREVRSELRVVRREDPAAEFMRSAIAASQRPDPGSFLVPSTPAKSAYLTRRWVEDTAPPQPAANPGILLLAPITGSAPLPSQRPDDLVDLVERLRQGDSRFNQLNAQVQGGMVRLSGTVSHDGDAMDLAQRLSRLPGVERVIIGDVRIALTLPGRQ
jgi:hypothetical protein